MLQSPTRFLFFFPCLPVHSVTPGALRVSCRTDFRVRLSFFVDPTCLQSLCLQSFCFHFHTTPSTVNLVCWCNERLASARGAGTGALSLPALFTVKLLSLSAFVSGARADQRAGISELAVMDSRVEVIKTALCLRCLLFFLLSPLQTRRVCLCWRSCVHTVRPPDGSGVERRGEGAFTTGKKSRDKYLVL